MIGELVGAIIIYVFAITVVFLVACQMVFEFIQWIKKRRNNNAKLEN